jgi:hypothetical protein
VEAIMLKVFLKEPVPHAYQKDGDLARTMQVMLVQGDESTFEKMLLDINKENLAEAGTWYKFIRSNGVAVFVPALNIAWVDVIEKNESRKVS